MSDESKLPSWKHSAFVGLIAATFLGLGIPSLFEAMRLRQKGEVVKARVTDSRVMRGKYGISHEVRYAFEATPGEEAFTRSDFLGRRDLWSTLPEEEWNKVVAAGVLAVRYDPADPVNNAPDIALPRYSDSGAAIGIGLMLLACVVVIERLRYKRNHLPRPPRLEV